MGARHGVGANNAMVKHTQTVVFGEAVISVTRFKDIRCHTVLVSFVMRKNKFETLFCPSQFFKNLDLDRLLHESELI